MMTLLISVLLQNPINTPTLSGPEEQMRLDGLPIETILTYKKDIFNKKNNKIWFTLKQENLIFQIYNDKCEFLNNIRLWSGINEIMNIWGNVLINSEN